MRTLLIFAVLFAAVLYAFRLFRPVKHNRQDNIQGKPRDSQRTIDKNQIEDVQFKDIPEK